MIILFKKILSTEKDITSLRNKLNDALIILTDDEMFSTQKASTLSSALKRRLNAHAEILCSISIGTNDTFQNRLEIDSFRIEPASGSNEKTYTLIDKTSFVHAFAVNEIESAKKVFDVKTVNELLIDIQLKNTELERSLKNLRIAKDQNARMESELEVGQSIQMSMLPKEKYQSDSINLYAKLIPAREVGGDFYDFFEVDSGRLGMVMGDVSGKGVPAALMMAVTKTLLKSRAVNDKSTASILTHVNNEIAKENDAYMFITVFMAILDINTGELTYSNAGHNPSYIINKESRKIKKLSDLHGPVVGAMEGMAYGETKLSLKKNDIVFSYTDGVTESHNSDAELYSDPRLEELLKSGEYDSTKTLTDLVISSVKEFEGDADQFDDITVMSIEYCQSPTLTSSIVSSINITNDLKQIAQAIEWYEAFALENKIPFAVIQKINIVLDELLNNIISYGYNDEEEHEIEIEVQLIKNRLILIISDDGIPFNPFKNEAVDVSRSIEEREIGGLGVHLVKTLMDDYEYNRLVDKNIITLIKQDISA